MSQINIFIVSAPSGSGKSTLLDRLMAAVPNLVFSVSYTTRKPRGLERDGKHYYFVGREQFQYMIEHDEFLEWADVFGEDLYGTPRRFLDVAEQLDHDLVLDIDVQGAGQVKQRLPEVQTIFLLPPSRQVLEDRLRRRGEDSQQVIEHRLRRAVAEIEKYPDYDYLIINEKLDLSAEQLCAIVLAARWEKHHDGRPADPQVRHWFELAESCRTRKVAPAVGPIQQTFREVTTG